MNIENIKEIMKLFSETKIRNLKLEQESFKIELSKDSIQMESVATAVAPAMIETKQEESNAPVEMLETIEKEAIDENIFLLTSPIIGVFYAAPSPDSEPFAKVGDLVEEGQTLCIVEAMKIMNELEAEHKGEIVEILVENEDIVEIGQPIMKIRRV